LLLVMTIIISTFSIRFGLKSFTKDFWQLQKKSSFHITGMNFYNFKTIT
jgi:hypothetical protein